MNWNINCFTCKYQWWIQCILPQFNHASLVTNQSKFEFYWIAICCSIVEPSGSHTICTHAYTTQHTNWAYTTCRETFVDFEKRFPCVVFFTASRPYSWNATSPGGLNPDLCESTNCWQSWGRKENEHHPQHYRPCPAHTEEICSWFIH